MTRTLFEEPRLNYHIVEDESTGQYFVGPILPQGRRVLPIEPKLVRHSPVPLLHVFLVAGTWLLCSSLFWWFVIHYGWAR